MKKFERSSNLSSILENAMPDHYLNHPRKRNFEKKLFLRPQRHPSRIGHFKRVKRRQKAKFLKLALNPPKSAKRIKQTGSLPFWGVVGIKKWSPFLCLGTRSAIFWHLKTRTFAKKTETTFQCQHPPKQVTNTFVLCVYHFWVGFKPIFENHGLEPFWSNFYPLKWPNF